MDRSMSDVGLIYGVGRREARVIAVDDDDESCREACWREGGVRPSRGRHPEMDHGFRGSIPGPYLYLPCQRFAHALARGPRMTRGRRVSLRLGRTTLSFTA